MSAVIEADGLTKRWGSLTAVDDLSLSVAEGECYAFLGRNGAGKSTTARMMLDFIRPSSGTTRLLGRSGRDPGVRARVGYLPGDLNLPKSMNGHDAIHFFGAMSHAPDSDEVDDLLDRFGLDPHRPFHELSTGNRRKVGLVLAFMNRPDVLILDEPTSGLDPILQETFRELLAERKAGGATIWLTSHVMAEVERVADRVGLIDDGHLAQELTMEELRRQTTGRIRFSFNDPPPSDAFGSVAGVTSVDVSGTDVFVQVDGPVTDVLARAAQLDAIQIQTQQRDLDEIFLETYEEGGHGG